MKEILVKSTIDGSMQPNLFYETEEKHRPLLVGLHTWSHDRFNQVDNMLPLAKKNNWNLLLPEFRGENLPSNPHGEDACGSEKAKQDIIDAVNYVKENYDIDEENILLLGASGGGHMSLLMAAYAPKLWRAVCSFVPITDMGVWHQEAEGYRDGIEHCCGKYSPDNEEYKKRSPITYVEEIAQAQVKIYSGKWDSVVPCHHGLDLYNEIFKKHPEAKVYFEMFDGGHQMLLKDAERWFVAHTDSGKEEKVEVTG